MEENDLQDLRKKIFSDVEPSKPLAAEQGLLLGILKADPREAPEPTAAILADAAPAEAPTAAAEPAPSLTEEEREALTLREVKMLISEYRLRIAESERRLVDLRYRLAGLETEYKAVMGEPVTAPPPPPPAPPAAVQSPAPAPPAAAPPASASPAPKGPRPRPRAWEDSNEISLEEAAWRILTELGKSLDPWRVVAAVKRRGFRRPFTEEALVKECRKSTRLGISAGGNIYLK
jgi:hypothetical protein